MTQRSRDNNWRNVRAVRDELARITARWGLSYRIEVDLEDTAVLTALVWDVDGHEVLRISRTAGYRWMYVSEWILELVDELVTELALCGYTLKEDHNGSNQH